MSKKQFKTFTCPTCGKEMERYGKKFNFFTMLFVACIIWPMFLFLPFVGMLPVRHTCRSCKKSYKEKDLI